MERVEGHLHITPINEVVDVDVLGKQWMISARRTRAGGSDSHWLYFSTKIRRFTRPITVLKTLFRLNPSSELSWLLKTQEFRQQTKLCTCRLHGQFKGNLNIHHRKGEFPSMASSFFAIVKNYPKMRHAGHLNFFHSHPRTWGWVITFAVIGFWIPRNESNWAPRKCDTFPLCWPYAVQKW